MLWRPEGWKVELWRNVGRPVSSGMVQGGSVYRPRVKSQEYPMGTWNCPDSHLAAEVLPLGWLFLQTVQSLRGEILGSQ